jgi:hypothetical protein
MCLELENYRIKMAKRKRRRQLIARYIDVWPTITKQELSQINHAYAEEAA